MTVYRVKKQYVFEGNFYIEADSKEEAREYSEKHCGMTIGPISSSLPYEDIDWDFNVHPVKERTLKIKKR
jgi:hypothetical protein